MSKNAFLNIGNYFKIIFKPHRILPYLKFLKEGYVSTKKEKEQRMLSYEKVNAIYRHSVEVLSVLSENLTGESLKVFTIEQFASLNRMNLEDADELGALFKKYGSDKATVHDYHIVYHNYLKPIQTKPLRVLEIGLGTNNTTIESNMGSDGKPGASVRAFRDFLLNSQIYGGDIDRSILFTDERISTFYIDQTDLDLMLNLKNSPKLSPFDLIIDDGLHNTEASIKTFIFAKDMLVRGGIFICEDINEDDIAFYGILNGMISKDFNCLFIRAKVGCLFIAIRR
jgi:hypothetical protein